MSSKFSPFAVPPRWQWVIKPTVVTGAGGTALAPILEETAIAAVEFLPLAALPGMAGIIFWFNQRIFNSTRPGSKTD
jgi:hypothetical protein